VFKKSVTFETSIVILSVLAKDLHLATRNADASEYLSMTTSQFLPPRDFLETVYTPYFRYAFEQMGKQS
jgi:hypothetical protein